MRRLLDHILLISAVIVFCGPVVWVLGRALAPGVLQANFVDLRQTLSPDAYGPGIGRIIWVSFALATGVAAATVVLSFGAAFALTISALRFASFWFWAIVATLYFPIEARMLQTFEVTVWLGLTSTFTALVLPVLPLALGTLYLRQHLKRLPPEIFEAARVDGAGPFRCLLQIALPLSLRPLGTLGLIAFIWGWNQYLWPLMASVDDRHWTLVRALERVGAGSGAGLMLATLSLLPPLLLVLLFSRNWTRLGDLRVQD